MHWLIWDWNGTLLDDVAPSLRFLNKMLLQRNLPVISLERYRELFRFPIRDYYRLAGIDLEKESYESLADIYAREYPKEATDVCLTSGAVETLAVLKSMGFGQIILSACQHDTLKQQVRQFGISAYFDKICGSENNLGEGKVALGKAWLDRVGATPDRIWMIGDTLHDHAVAQALNCRCILFTGGHQNRERLLTAHVPVIDSLSELPNLLSGQM